MASGVDSSRPTGPHSVPQNNADMISASGVTPVDSPNSSGSTIWPSTRSQATIQPSTRKGCAQPGVTAKAIRVGSTAPSAVPT